MSCREIDVASKDSTPLLVRYYDAHCSERPRNAVIVHGAGEHGQRYDHVARVMAERGWNVIIGDLRGHGRSGGHVSHVGRFSEYLDDLDAIWSTFSLDPECTALIGHSTGGLISIRYLQTRHDRASALVLLAPLLAIKVPVNPLKVALGRVVRVVAPRVQFRTTVDPASTTRNSEVLERRLNDPLIQSSISAGWYFAVKDAMQRAFNEAGRIHVPLLVLQGTLDKIVDPEAPEPWFQRVAGPDKTFRSLTDHYHELLNEPDWPQTLQFILDWLQCRVSSSRCDSPSRVTA